jgi:hypothetical protein
MAKTLVTRDSDRRCFTINHWTPDEAELINNQMTKEEVISMTVGQEVGSEGTPHLQGFIVFKWKATGAALKAALGGRAHIEVMRGTVRQNDAYCKKEGNILVAKGVDQRVTAVSKRDMWAEVLKGAKELHPEEFQQQYPDHWVLRRGAIERIMIEAQGSRASIWAGDLQSKNYWIWGAPGLGKSRWAADQNPIATTCKKCQ